MAMISYLRAIPLVLLCLISLNANGKSLTVAVAANFAPLLKELTAEFEQQAQTKVKISSASSGVLYQQILHGAPFDIFLSADNLRTALLVKQGQAIADSRKVYAIGQLALWHNGDHAPSLNLLKQYQGRLAIANPKTAPYGLAAKQALNYLNLWQNYTSRLVIGTNINQSYQQVHSKAITLGLVSYSQLLLNNQQHKALLLPKESYQPLSQELVVLTQSKQQTLARQFSDYLLSPVVQAKIAKSGYLISSP
jgi:molybdate transport system substrate-binding protein